MLFRSISRKRAWAGIAILALAAACAAQPTHRRVKTPHHRKAHVRAEKKPAAAQVSAAATPAPPPPLRPLNQPAKPATISLSAGKLAVKADNSSLVQILDQLGKSGGMSISGLNQDQRVFGDYGPGNPSQILSELLEGAGYNVLMLGVTREGTPKELVLSERGNAPPSSPQSFPSQTVQPFYQQPVYQRPPVPPPPQGNLNFPGHTPAEMYQQMMKQREQQQQQQQQPPQ
jgi:hypothetical protein